MLVNSYLIHGPDGVVVVDGQLTISDARKVRRAVEASGLPLAGLLITHPHPDHYAGVAEIAGDPGVPVVATAAVDAIIRRDDALKHEIVGPMMGSEWPTDRRFPTDIIGSGDAVQLGGLTLSVRDGGPGESHGDTLWTLDERTVFPGDIAYNDMHAYLADGHVDEWLAALAALDGELADDVTLHVGHGEPAGKQLLGQQSRYVEAFVDAVRANADREPAQRDAAVVAAMTTIVDNDRLLFLMQLSIEPLLHAGRAAP